MDNHDAYQFVKTLVQTAGMKKTLEALVFHLKDFRLDDPNEGYLYNLRCDLQTALDRYEKRYDV